MKTRTGSGAARVLAIVAGVLLLSCLLCCGSALMLGLISLEEDKAKLAEANRQWDAGQKADAVAVYKRFIERNFFPDDTQRPLLYQRAIEYDLERGDTSAAKATAEKAVERKVELPNGNKAMAELVAQVRAERAQREAEEAARREAEEKRKRDEREAEAKRKEEERKNAPRLSVELIKVRLKPFRTVDGLNTTMVYVDWKNVGNRPVRWLTAKFTLYDENGTKLDSSAMSELGIYSAPDNNAPGIAPDETRITPDDLGKVIPPLLNPRVTRVVAEILKVHEKVPE